MDDYSPPRNISIQTNPNNPTTKHKEGNSDLMELLNTFDSISLAEMDSVRLMNRVDTKYLIERSQLNGLLEKAHPDYRIVEVEKERLLLYSTIYFDTENVDMYLMHHNRKLNRFKIRMRSYVHSNISFLEVKRKTNKGRTSKKRVRIPMESFQNRTFSEAEQNFLREKSPYEASRLIPHIKNNFHRITLVDNKLSERVTLDIEMTSTNLINGKTQNMDGLVIVEMKQDGACNSLFGDYLKELKIKSGSMSKYCMGMVLLNPELKYNRFKQKIGIITKIIEKYHDTI